MSFFYRILPFVPILMWLAGPAYAGIASSTGDITLLASPPASVAPGALESDTEIFAFPEGQNILLGTSLPAVLAVANPVLNGSALPTADNLPPGMVVNSYLFHADSVVENGQSTVSGTVTFDESIVAVIVSTANLTGSDATLGAVGTVYGADPLRGLENADDLISISADLRTLSIQFSRADVEDHVRVITQGSVVGFTLTSPSIETKAVATAPGGGTASDNKGPALSGTLESNLLDALGYLRDFSPNAYAAASQSADGTNAVSIEGLYGGGSPGDGFGLFAQTRWSQTAQIGPSDQNVELDLVITPSQLFIIDWVGFDTTGSVPIVRYELEVLANKAQVFHVDAQLEGGISNHSLSGLAATHFNPVYFEEPGWGLLGYNFDGSVEKIEMGTFAAGSYVTVEYIMTIEADIVGFEDGAGGFIGDPFDLNGSGTTLGLAGAPAIVAVPALAPLGLGLLGGLVILLGALRLTGTRR